MEAKYGLTTDNLRTQLKYDPETGLFHWRASRVGCRPGKIAGNSKSGWAVRIRIHSVCYYAHRLVWLYVHGRWPTVEIDHINGNPKDNRLANLREATHGENLRNTKKRSDNRSGYKGVAAVWNGSWRATIRGRHIGTFPTREEARDAYQVAAKAEFGVYARFE
jgi:hypothetical protein